VSLITDALGLRQGRSGKKITRQERLPFQKPPGQGREIKVIVGVLVLIALGFFVYLRGTQTYEWLEGVALGVSPKIVPAIPAVSVPVSKAIQPETLLTATQKDRAPIENNNSILESSGRPSGDPASQTVPAVEPSKEVKKVTEVGAVKSTADSETLHPVLVESIEKIKSMDPKVLEQERRNRVENFLLNLRVQGVRIHGAESRIMVDGALISVGDAIGDFGLRLKSVDSGRLVFVDSEGQEYPKSY
jgi:hypothetical protein